MIGFIRARPADLVPGMRQKLENSRGIVMKDPAGEER
jgi:hypothetical protein